MTVQSVTLQLSEALMQRARQTADALQHPLEEVLASVLAAALPDVDNVPPTMQAELARMTWLNDRELWRIAHTTMPDTNQQRLSELAELQAQRSLTPQESRTLAALREDYSRVTLKKARAYALLSLRGGQPLLAEN